MYKKYIGIMVALAIVGSSLPFGVVKAEDATTTEAVASTTEAVAVVAPADVASTTPEVQDQEVAAPAETVSAPEEIVVETAPAVVAPVLPIVSGSCFNPVLPQRAGDINLDGNVNAIDLALLQGGYNISSSSPAYTANADMNHDGVIDFNELVAIAQNYNSQTIAYTAFASLGDANQDGAVNAADNAILGATYNKVSTDAGFDARADFTHDNIVDFNDMVVMAQHFNMLSLPACVVVPQTPTTPTTPSNGGSSYTGGAGIGGGSYTAELTVATTTGEVLGTSTVATNCASMISSYIKFGADNNLNDVVKLQVYLRNNIDAQVAITGIYDTASLNAVNAFQVKYADDVLAPWVPFGLESTSTPTGYVYKTTSWKFNTLVCPTASLPKPQLP